MEPVMETIGQAAAEQVPAAETAIDYTEQLETIVAQLHDVINNQNFIGVTLSDYREIMDNLLEEIDLIRQLNLQLVDLQKYVSGFALFFVICALCVFVYKFFRIFF